MIGFLLYVEFDDRNPLCSSDTVGIVIPEKGVESCATFKKWTLSVYRQDACIENYMNKSEVLQR